MTINRKNEASHAMIRLAHSGQRLPPASGEEPTIFPSLFMATLHSASRILGDILTAPRIENNNTTFKIQNFGENMADSCQSVASRSAEGGCMATKLVIGIASTGRPAIVTRTVVRLKEQSVKPDRILICVADETDIVAEGLAGLDIAPEIIVSERGLTKQRNTILARLRPEEILVFIDDDFILAQDFCKEALDLFQENPAIVMATGSVLLDGIVGPGLTFDKAEAFLAEHRPSERRSLHPVYNCYGCNMVIRAAPVIEHGLRFDERLPFYGWLEDVDFSRAIASHGLLVMSTSMQGVHLGTKAWRSPGVKLGYSQVANPIYLASKGTMAVHRAAVLMLRNLSMNVVRSFRPEPWVDRRGRLRGNFLAVADLLAGRLCPERAGVVE